jgi:hypothetical protein
MGDGHGAGNGARLRLARQARGFSQQQLADINSDFATCVPFSEGQQNGRRVVVRADRTAACAASYVAWRGPAGWQRAPG